MLVEKHLPAALPYGKVGWSIDGNVDPDIILVQPFAHQVSDFLHPLGVRCKNAEVSIWNLVRDQATSKRRELILGGLLGLREVYSFPKLRLPHLDVLDVFLLRDLL